MQENQMNPNKEKLRESYGGIDIKHCLLVLCGIERTQVSKHCQCHSTLPVNGSSMEIEKNKSKFWEKNIFSLRFKSFVCFFA